MGTLTEEQLATIARATRDLDPEQEYVALDVEARHVEYKHPIRAHEAVGDYVGDEEAVRAFLVAWLCTLGGYPSECIDLEKRYLYGRDGHAELDIRVSDAGDVEKAFALIEVKAPHDFKGATDSRIEGQLFAIAGHEPDCQLLALATIEVGDEGSVAPNAVTIHYDPSLTYARWIGDGRTHVTDIPVAYDEPTQVPFAPGTDRDLRTDLDQKALDRLRRQLHDRLWGGSRDDNQIYAWLVKLFLTKILDEKLTDEGEPYKFQVMHEGARRESTSTTLERVSKRYADAYVRYVDPGEMRVEPLDEALFSAHETQWVVERLQGLSLTAAGRSCGDLLGSFFETITRDGFKQSKGLFFTHYNLAVFMLEVLEVGPLAEEKLRSNAHPNDRLPYMIDPSCGSGTFLLAAMRIVSRHVEARRAALSRNRDVREQLQMRFPEGAPNTWAKDFIYGIEKREDLAVSSKVNMVLHRDGHTHVFRDDGLASFTGLASRHGEEKFRPHPDPDGLYEQHVVESFDIVITNPPFSITLDDAIRAQLKSTFELATEKNSENLFLERWYQLLKHGGRLGAVLPESFFSTAENLSARLFLLAHFEIRAIVSLPSHAFQPWTPTRTSLLFARKRQSDSEARWKTSFQKHLVDATTARDLGLASAKKIARPVNRTTPAQLAGHVESVTKSLVRLGLPASDGGAGSARWAEGSIKLLKALQPEMIALRSTIAEANGAEFIGVSVGEVGYRRTRRAENARPNDLFRAVVGEGDAEEPVRNLSFAPHHWRLLLGGEDDALSVLRSHDLWG